MIIKRHFGCSHIRHNSLTSSFGIIDKNVDFGVFAEKGYLVKFYLYRSINYETL